MYRTRTEAARAGLPRHLWDLDLGDAKPRILGGGKVKRLEHAHCNRSAGAILGNKLRPLGITRRPTGYRAARAGTKARRRARW